MSPAASMSAFVLLGTIALPSRVILNASLRVTVIGSFGPLIFVPLPIIRTWSLFVGFKFECPSIVTLSAPLPSKLVPNNKLAPP